MYHVSRYILWKVYVLFHIDVIFCIRGKYETFKIGCIELELKKWNTNCIKKNGRIRGKG